MVREYGDLGLVSERPISANTGLKILIHDQVISLYCPWVITTEFNVFFLRASGPAETLFE